MTNHSHTDQHEQRHKQPQLKPPLMCPRLPSLLCSLFASCCSSLLRSKFAGVKSYNLQRSAAVLTVGETGKKGQLFTWTSEVDEVRKTGAVAVLNVVVGSNVCLLLRRRRSRSQNSRVSVKFKKESWREKGRDKDSCLSSADPLPAAYASGDSRRQVLTSCAHRIHQPNAAACVPRQIE